jgi:hypothetical protein
VNVYVTKMPFVKVFTNLSKDKLPSQFMPLFVKKLGVILDKDVNKFNWMIETDKQMSKVRTFCKKTLNLVGENKTENPSSPYP